MSLKPMSAARVIMTAEASRRFGLTPRAMRYYEERGLIDVDRDWQNRRCYDEAAQQRLAWIATLRSARLPLRDVEDVLLAEVRHGGGAALADQKLAELSQSFADLQRSIEVARANISQTRQPIAA